MNVSDFNFGNPIGAQNPQGVWGQQYQGPPMPNSMMPNANGVMAPPAVNGAGTVGGAGNLASTGLGMNLGTGQLVLGGIQAIGNLWAAWEAQKLAKEQFGFQKDITNTNLANSIQSYNTTLSDRIGARSFMEGRPEGYAQQYIEENKARDLRAQ